MINYCYYGDSALSHIDHAALCEHNRQEGDLLARAENSGCEGHYVEVARWSYKRERWERYCHFKFLGGEDRQREGWTPKQLAEHYAREINDAYNANQGGLALIHKLPDWDAERTLAEHQRVTETWAVANDGRKVIRGGIGHPAVIATAASQELARQIVAEHNTATNNG